MGWSGVGVELPMVLQLPSLRTVGRACTPPHLTGLLIVTEIINVKHSGL